ncbi:MAG: sugar transferase [bacterium]|nr:sugar transferase [bacterium]
MGIQRRVVKSIILFLSDVTTLYAALFLALMIRHSSLPPLWFLKLHLTPFSIIFIVWLIVFYIAGLYELRAIKNTPSFYERFAKTFLFNAATAIAIFYLVPYFKITPRTTLFLVLVIAFILIALERFAAQTVMATKGASRVLFFGFSKEVLELTDFLKQNPQLGFLPTAVMTSDNEKIPKETSLKIFSFDSRLTNIVREEGVEIIVASNEIKKDEALIQMLFKIIPMGIPVVDFLSFYEASTGKIPVSLVGEIWFLENLIGIRRPFYEFAKRAIDALLAIAISIIVIPFIPFIILAIRFDTAGPAFYRQKRVGRHGRLIEIIKFRTMRIGAEHGSAKWADENDSRVTKVGGFLRRSRIDELPQLWSVFIGDLSLVGPRPERPEFVSLLEKKIPFYQMRHLVQPGLSGWAQIHFPYGSSVEDALEKLQYDLAYIKNRSIWLDLTTALKTASIVLSRAGR